MYVPYLQLRTQEVFVYQSWEGARHPRTKEDLPARPPYSGEVTAGAVKRLKRAISLMVQKSPTRRIWNPVVQKYHDYQLGFVTLTVADQGEKSHRDVYKELLAPWLRWARTRGVKDYVWRAELQKRGEIHYHLIINQFIHYQVLQDHWNKYQKRHGYLQSFGRKHGHFRPNSVDIHSVHKVQDVEGYMAKYMSKSVGEKIDGKIWDASLNLKKAKYYSDHLTPENISRLRLICKQEKEGEFCTMFKVPKGYIPKVLDPTQLMRYHSFLSSI